MSDIVQEARLVAGALDYKDGPPAKISVINSARLLRQLADIVERLEAEVSMLSREVSREAGLRHTLTLLLQTHHDRIVREREADHKAREAAERSRE